MQQKLIEILAAATDWMTDAEIAGKGGWRSAANVGVALQQMEKADGCVERRKSDKKKQGNGMPATEWKLHIMTMYSAVLGERIAAFPPDVG